MQLKNYETGCVCTWAHCVCTDEERLVRARLQPDCRLPPLTDDERYDLIEEAIYCGKGEYSEEDLQPLSDRDLCAAVIDAWTIMARKHGLL